MNKYLFIGLVLLTVFAFPIKTMAKFGPTRHIVRPTAAAIRKENIEAHKNLRHEIHEQKKNLIKENKAQREEHRQKWQDMFQGKSTEEKKALIPTMKAEREALFEENKAERKDLGQKIKSSWQGLGQQVKSSWQNFWQSFRK
jgi:hypothetical protein